MSNAGLGPQGVWLRGQGWEGSERAGAPFTSFYWLHSVSAIKMERIKFLSDSGNSAQWQCILNIKASLDIIPHNQ